MPPLPPRPPAPPPAVPPSPSPPGCSVCQPWCAANLARNCELCACQACAGCAPSAPPPVPPPQVPGIILIDVPVVEVIVTLAGAVYDYNITERRTQLISDFASRASVPPSAVALSILGASVQLSFRVDEAQTPDVATATALTAMLSASLGTARAASQALRAPVVSNPQLLTRVERRAVKHITPTAPPRVPVRSMSSGS